MSSIHVPSWAWVLLGSLLAVFIAIDLISHRGHQADSRRRAVAWSIVWIGAALAFNVFVAIQFGIEAGEQFLAAYLLEKSLSVDNLFLFLVIFGALRIPPADQHKVLTWGIIGALVTRLVFIVLGVAVIQRWHEVTYVFGALLLVTAIKLLRKQDEDASPPKLMLWLQKHLKLSTTVIAILTIELTDIVFALDSIPAAFAVSEDTFILYSSNVFAVLGLRALYIVLAGALHGLRYLHYGLAAVLGFAGTKMLIASWVKFPPLISVSVIAACLVIAVVASIGAKDSSPVPHPRRSAEGSAEP